MKKLFFALPLLALAFFLGACSTAQQQTAQQAAAKAQALLTQGCSVVQPTLASVQLIDPAVAPFVVANVAFCAAVATVNVTSIQAMINTSIPQAEQLIQNSSLIPADQKPIVIGALTAFQVLLGQIMLVLQNAQPADTTAPASAAVAS